MSESNTFRLIFLLLLYIAMASCTCFPGQADDGYQNAIGKSDASSAEADRDRLKSRNQAR